MKTLKLILLTILKYSFFIITYPIIWVLLLIDVVIHLLSFRYIELDLMERFSSFCVYVAKAILKKEFEIIFGK